MSSKYTIKCIALVNLPIQKIITYQSHHELNEDIYCKDLSETIKTIALMTLSADSKENGIVKTINNNQWHYKINYEKYCFLILCQENYPSPKIIQLLSHLEKILFEYSIQDNEKKTIAIVNERIRNILNNNKIEFEENDNFSKIDNQFNKINEEMNKNIKNAMINQNKLIDIEKKTYNIAEMAKKFNKNSIEVKKQEQNNEIKFYFWLIIIGVILIVILFSIILTIYDESESIDDTKEKVKKKIVKKIGKHISKKLI